MTFPSGLKLKEKENINKITVHPLWRDSQKAYHLAQVASGVNSIVTKCYIIVALGHPKLA